jgi:hypothetical protein
MRAVTERLSNAYQGIVGLLILTTALVMEIRHTYVCTK